jgi:hypothetical protein
MVNSDIPAAFDYHLPDGARLAHRVLFGIELPAAQALAFSHLFAQINFLPIPSIQLPDMVALLEAVDLHDCSRMINAWCADDVVQAAVLLRYKRTLCHHKGVSLDTPFNAVDPSYFRTSASSAPVDWVFVDAMVGAENLSLALAARWARLGIAMMTTPAYLDNPGPVGRKLLLDYKLANRLVLLKYAVDGVDRAWIVVFESSGTKARMLATHGTGSLTWVCYNSLFASP